MAAVNNSQRIYEKHMVLASKKCSEEATFDINIFSNIMKEIHTSLRREQQIIYDYDDSYYTLRDKDLITPIDTDAYQHLPNIFFNNLDSIFDYIEKFLQSRKKPISHPFIKMCKNNTVACNQLHNKPCKYCFRFNANIKGIKMTNKFLNKTAGVQNAYTTSVSQTFSILGYGTDNQVVQTGITTLSGANGNVGIGTTNPAALLHVAGNILSNGFTSIIAKTSVSVFLSGGLGHATPAYTNSTWINGTRAMYLFVMSAIDFAYYGANGVSLPYAGIALFAPQNFFMVAFSTQGATTGVNTCNFAGGVIELTGTTTITLSYYQRTSIVGGTTAPFNFSIYAI